MVKIFCEYKCTKRLNGINELASASGKVLDIVTFRIWYAQTNFQMNHRTSNAIWMVYLVIEWKVARHNITKIRMYGTLSPFKIFKPTRYEARAFRFPLSVNMLSMTIQHFSCIMLCMNVIHWNQNDKENNMTIFHISNQYEFASWLWNVFVWPESVNSSKSNIYILKLVGNSFQSSVFWSYVTNRKLMNICKVSWIHSLF